MAERETRTRRSDDRTRSTTARRRAEEPEDDRGRERKTRKTRPAEHDEERRDERRARHDGHRDAHADRHSDKHSDEHGREHGDGGEPRSEGEHESEARSDRRSGIGAQRAAAAAVQCVKELIGRQPESLTSLERTDGGWRVGVEAVESRRVPDSTDIMAVYQVDLDQDGEMVGYRRERRYYRGRVEGVEQ